MPFPQIIPDAERFAVGARKFLDYVTPHLAPPQPPLNPLPAPQPAFDAGPPAPVMPGGFDPGAARVAGVLPMGNTPAPAMPGGFDPGAALPPPSAPPSPTPQAGPRLGGFDPTPPAPDPEAEAQRFAAYVGAHPAMRAPDAGDRPSSASAPASAFGGGFDPGAASAPDPAAEANRFAHYTRATAGVDPMAAGEGDRPASEFAPPSQAAADPFARRVPDVTGPVTVAGVTTPSPLASPPLGPEQPWVPPAQIDLGDVGLPGNPLRPPGPSAPEADRMGTLRPDLAQVSQGRPGPLDVLAATDVPNRVGFAAAHALLTGQDPAQAILETARAGGAQPTGETLLADAGMPAGEARRVAGKYLDAGLDWRNVVPGLAGGGEVSVGRQLVAEPLGAVLGSEGGGALGQAVGGDTGRAVGETLGGIAGAGVAGAGYQRVAEDPATYRMGITEGGEGRGGLADVSRRPGETDEAFVARLARGDLPRSTPAPLGGGGEAPPPAAYTNVSTVPITAAPELEGAVVQATQSGLPEHRLGERAPGPAAPELVPTFGRPIEQGTLVDPHDYYRGPVDVPAQTPAPGARRPMLTTQAPLITEPVAGQPRSGFMERVYDRASLVRMAGMLSAVPTHLLNVAGNTVMGGLALAQKPAQVGADLARVGVGRALGRDVERQRYMAEVLPQAEGYARGLWAGLRQVPGILAHGLPADFARRYDARGLASGSAALDTAVEAPLRALAASDAVFRGAAFGGHAAALATRQATREGLSGAARSQRARQILGNLSDYPGLLGSANRLAARDVFQEPRAVTDAIAALKRDNPGARVAADVFLPFYKTPYNVAAQGAGMTPAGYVSAIQAAVKGETGEAVDRAVRATAGTAGVLLGLDLASKGLLTGPYPQDAAERSTLPEGWKSYSLRIPRGDGAVYLPVTAFGALAVPLGIAAGMQDAVAHGKPTDGVLKTVYRAVGETGRFMMDLSAFQGLNAVSKLVTEPERSVEAFTESLAASLVPDSGLMRGVQQALDDAQRDPSGPLEAFLAAVPGLSPLVQTRQTPLGQDRSRGPAGPVALLTGSRVGVEQPDSVVAAFRASGVGVTAPPAAITTGGGERVALTPDEQRVYRTAVGDALRPRVERMLAHPDWARLGPDRRRALLTDAQDTAREEAAVRVLRSVGRDEVVRRVRAGARAAS